MVEREEKALIIPAWQSKRDARSPMVSWAMPFDDDGDLVLCFVLCDGAHFVSVFVYWLRLMGGKIGLGKHRCSRPKIAHLTKGRLLNVLAAIAEGNHERLKLE